MVQKIIIKLLYIILIFVFFLFKHIYNLYLDNSTINKFFDNLGYLHYMDLCLVKLLISSILH